MKKKTLTFIVILICAALAYLSDYKPDEITVSNDGLKVSFFDVGQGDSTFIELPDGETMLIDAANPEDGEFIKEKIERTGYKKIDYLVATHPHSDHIGGMAEIVNEFEIGNVYMPKVSHNTSSFEKLVDAISQKNIKIKEAKAGTVVFEKEDLKAYILSPKRDYEDLNNYSVVLKLEYKDTDFLFTGDAEKEVEHELLKSGADLKAQVLKVGHHGSSTSSDKKFISAVSPQYAVISCGEDNDYGHPHKETLKVLESSGTEILRTDILGDIKVFSDGENIKVEKSE